MKIKASEGDKMSKNLNFDLRLKYVNLKNA